MKHIKILTIVGARPQFIKAIMVSRLIGRKYKHLIVHTGQHYDPGMSAGFFKELGLPEPDYNLGVGSAPGEKQIFRMVEKLRGVLLRERPAIAIVYGDTNSTLAGALAAAMLGIPIAHIEAGLRSFRPDMPEENNRVLTDHLSALLFCPTQNAVANLRREGIKNGVHNVGDVMYDACRFFLKRAVSQSRILDRHKLCKKSYYLATIHRAANTDNKARLKKIISIFSGLDKIVVLPLHPRTKKALRKFRIKITSPDLKLIPPVSYLDMLKLEANAKAILTDSGGVQKEAFFLNIPCITLREETEWPETVKHHGNILTSVDNGRVTAAIKKHDNLKLKSRNCVLLFGNAEAAKNTVKILDKFIHKNI